MQVTVNTNFSEIQKLPSKLAGLHFRQERTMADRLEYASFGKLSKQATEAAVADLVEVGLARPSPRSLKFVAHC